MSRRGFFLTFEGLDGAGKSTQLRLLADALRAGGEPVRTLRQPGGTALGDRLRGLLVETRSGAPLAPRAELALLFADRVQAITEVVEPALAAGEAVLCDRWTDSTEAYQGGGRGLGSAVVLELDRSLCGGLQPDLTMLLQPPLSTALGRARQRNQHALQRSGSAESRFESEADAFFKRVDAAYRAIAAREPVRVVAMETDEGIEAVHARIVKVAYERLARFRAAPTNA